MNFTDTDRAATHARDFWDKRYRNFDLSESGWMGAGERYNGYIYECKRQALRRALRRIGVDRNSALHVLDAGCGQGYFAGVWEADYPKAIYTGVDISEKAVAYIQLKYPRYQFFVGDLTVWRNPGHACFDLIHA